MIRKLLVIFIAALPSIAVAQLRPDSVLMLSTKQLDSAANPTRTPEKPGRLLAKSTDNESYLIVVRTKPGDVEIHEQFDDITIVRSGKGVLRTGHQVSGARPSGNGPDREWLGGTIEDKRDRKIAEGDFLVIPAGLGHQYIPEPGETLTYVVIKVRNVKKPK